MNDIRLYDLVRAVSLEATARHMSVPADQLDREDSDTVLVVAARGSRSSQLVGRHGAITLGADEVLLLDAATGRMSQHIMHVDDLELVEDPRTVRLGPDEQDVVTDLVDDLVMLRGKDVDEVAMAEAVRTELARQVALQGSR